MFLTEDFYTSFRHERQWDRYRLEAKMLEFTDYLGSQSFEK